MEGLLRRGWGVRELKWGIKLFFKNTRETKMLI